MITSICRGGSTLKSHEELSFERFHNVSDFSVDLNSVAMGIAIVFVVVMESNANQKRREGHIIQGNVSLKSLPPLYVLCRSFH